MLTITPNRVIVQKRKIESKSPDLHNGVQTLILLGLISKVYFSRQNCIQERGLLIPGIGTIQQQRQRLI